MSAKIKLKLTMPAKTKIKLITHNPRPKKNPQGTSAGIPRASGQRDSPVSGGPGVNFVSLTPMIPPIAVPIMSLASRFVWCQCLPADLIPPCSRQSLHTYTCTHSHPSYLPTAMARIKLKKHQSNIAQDENDEYCSACGGNGDLVCCDGCTRAFHLICVDPPMESVSQLPPDWYCVTCGSLRTGPGANHRRRGLFGELTMLVEKRNPSAFHLPLSIRGWFEGVRTGPEGEYEEGNPPKK